jgi:hypothetical protein
LILFFVLLGFCDGYHRAATFIGFFSQHNGAVERLRPRRTHAAAGFYA